MPYNRKKHGKSSVHSIDRNIFFLQHLDLIIRFLSSQLTLHIVHCLICVISVQKKQACNTHIHNNSLFLPTWCTNSLFFKYIYYIPLHVSSTIMLILRMSNCISAASGIVTLETSEWSRLLKYIVCCIIINVRNSKIHIKSCGYN